MIVTEQFSVTATAPNLRFSQRPLVRALAAALLVAPLMASAATIQVTSSGNGIGAAGVCTLRSAGYALDSGAVNAGCTTATGVFGTNDTITFAPGITLINFDSYGGGIYVGNNSRTIQGTGFGGITLQRTLASVGQPIITFAGTGGNTLTLNGLTIEGGNVSGDGGGVNSQANGGNLVISNSVIRNNRATGLGGGVNGGYGGNITITNSTISGNTSGSNGGGIFKSGGFNISGSTISGNSSTGSWGGGAALLASCNNGSVVNSTISGNLAASGIGSGLDLESYSCEGSATIVITNNTIANNAGSAGVNLGCYGHSYKFSANQPTASHG